MDPEIPLKTSVEVEGIRNSCRIAAEILRSVGAHVERGISTRELDRIAAALMRQFGVEAGDRFGGVDRFVRAGLGLILDLLGPAHLKRQAPVGQ